MVIKCAFSVPPEETGDAGKWELPSLPEYISKKGPYIAGKKVITIYEFDNSRLLEGWKIISEQLEIFRNKIPGFIYSARVLPAERRNR